MQYLESLEAYQSDGPCVVTFGKFDGLHLGHQKLIREARKLAEREQIPCVVCAFDMGAKDQLLTKEERRQMLASRADVLIDCPFTPALKSQEAETFLKDTVQGRLHAAYVVVGTDFRFGYRKGGDVRLLEDAADRYGYRPVILEKEQYQGREISSTCVKEALNAGDISLADHLLGYAFGVDGVVEHGDQLGRSLGFPTCNIRWPADKLLPPKGVYLSRTCVDGLWYPGITNIGVKPTVSEEGPVLAETFLFGYTGNAYGKDISVRLLKFVRPEQKFDDVSALKAQVDADIASGKQFFGLQD